MTYLHHLNITQLVATLYLSCEQPANCRSLSVELEVNFYSTCNFVLQTRTLEQSISKRQYNLFNLRRYVSNDNHYIIRIIDRAWNRPFSSCLLPLFPNEFWHTTFHMEMNLTCTFIVLQIKLHIKSCILVLKDRQKATRKFPVSTQKNSQLVPYDMLCIGMSYKLGNLSRFLYELAW